MAAAGLLPDARSLAQYCRQEAADFRREYGRPIPIKTLSHNVASYVHVYTRHGSVRYLSHQNFKKQFSLTNHLGRLDVLCCCLRI